MLKRFCDYTLIRRPVQPAPSWRPIGILFFILEILVAAPPVAAAEPSAAVILSYQRIGEDTLPHASLGAEAFAAHVREFNRGGYTVLPLSRVIAAVKTGEPLPPRSIALVFDGAFSSSWANAFPLLDAGGYPYTVFFSADAIDRKDPGSLTWDQLRKLLRKKHVELGLLPAAYTHMIEEDMADNLASINRARGRAREELGYTPEYFVWPFGEYTLALKEKLAEFGFEAAFGYQAGALHPHADFLALPRFLMTDLFGSPDHLRQAAETLPLPVNDLTPIDPVISANPPLIGFSLAEELGPVEKLSCYVSGQGTIKPDMATEQRIELRPEKPFTERRTRVNCTLPVHDDSTAETAWRWLGMVFIVPDGSASEGRK